MKSASLLALLVVLTLGLSSIKAAKLPSTFKLCKRKDPNINECLKTALQQAIIELAPGVPGLHVLPLEPLAVTKIIIEDGAGRPVRLNLEFHNVSVNGFSRSEVNSFKADLENRILEADGIIQKALLEADYIMDGRFLVLPLKGKGKCKIDFIGLNATLKLTAEPQARNGNVYWNVVKFETRAKKLDNFKVRFDNLFNGDEALSESTNKILNENWQQLWEELKPSLEETFGAVFLQYSNELFHRVPEQYIFLE